MQIGKKEGESENDANVEKCQKSMNLGKECMGVHDAILAPLRSMK